MIEPLVVNGTIVTFDPAQPVVEDGALYVGADERIAAVQPAADPPPDGFAGARTVQTGGVVYPGLIDLHGHMVYNALPLWSPPGVTEPYTTRYAWPKDSSYKPLVSQPANALGALAGKALLKYVETKALVGGVTTVQGSAKMTYPYDGWLVRNVEYETFQTGTPSVYQSAVPLDTEADYAKDRDRMKAGNAFIYHVSEGTDDALVAEYLKLRDEDCLQPTLCAIHCVALEPENFAAWAPHGGSVVWSPFSNLWLYRSTTRVVEAHEAGMRICLGADWSPSGSKNLLGELKVADMWNRDHLGGAFSDWQLCEMVTCNPADALGWDDRLGRLQAGLYADFVAMADGGGDPYRNLIESVEADVLLVAINGQPCYGTPELVAAAGATHAEPIDVGAHARSIVLVFPDVPDADMGWADVLADLAAAVADPVARYLEIERLIKAGTPPPWLKTDKAWDDPDKTGELIPVDIDIPPLDTLTHDAAYFEAVERSPLHGGLLDGVRDYYKGV